MRNLRKTFSELLTLYTAAGPQLLVLLGIIFVASITEVVGIAMLLPILEYSNAGGEKSELTTFVFDAMSWLRLDVSLLNLLLLMVVIFALKGAIQFTRLFVGEWITSNLILRQQERLISAYSSTSYLHYTQLRSGTLTTLIFSEVERFGRAISKMVSVAAAVISVVMHLAAAAALRPDITVAIVIAGLLMTRFLRRIVTSTRATSIDMSYIHADAQSTLIQSIHSFLYLRASGSMRMMRDHILALLRRYIRLRNRLATMSSFLQSAVEPAAVVLLAALIYVQTVVEGKPIGEIMVLALLCHRAFTRLMAVQQEVQRYNESVGGVVTVTQEGGKLITHREVDDGTKAISLDREIVLQGVSFGYNDDTQALSDLDLRLPANSTLGIVGESGGGKSTLLLLLASVITPTKGAIYADGTDFRDVSKQAIREKIGYVTQEPVIFNGTISDNITLFAPDTDTPEMQRRVQDAARRAHCVDFINRLPDGFSSMLGERGVNLSGGQRQRIAIARELFRDPKLMILDEATSALDSESEQIIRDSIEQMRGERTIVIVAHRLSTIRHCDHIVVLSKGRIVEQGSYENLYNTEGSRFRTLVDAQRL